MSTLVPLLLAGVCYRCRWRKARERWGACHVCHAEETRALRDGAPRID